MLAGCRRDVQGLFTEIGELGGVFFKKDTDDDLGEVGDDEVSVNVSRKVRAPLVGVCFVSGFRATLLCGVTESNLSGGSSGIDGQSFSVSAGILVPLSCACLNGAWPVFNTVSSTGISTTSSNFLLLGLLPTGVAAIMVCELVEPSSARESFLLGSACCKDLEIFPNATIP